MTAAVAEKPAGRVAPKFDPAKAQPVDYDVAFTLMLVISDQMGKLEALANGLHRGAPRAEAA
jgi:hypothetical protein